MKLTIGFLGLGLIGGSIAKGIRLYHPDYTLIAYNHNYKTVETAKQEGIIDIAAHTVDETFSACDIIYLCMPVAHNTESLKQIKPYLKSSCILTDVGSVKGDIHKAVRDLLLEPHFIGGHPMAGSEKTGYENSTDHLLENAYYALTPCGCTAPEALECLRSLTASLKAIPVILSPNEHDYAVAGISHLPHMIASGLVNLIKHADSEQETMKLLAAGGFKDITRIASASPVMWQQICLTNGTNIAKIMEQYIRYFEEIRDAVLAKDSDYLYHFFEESKIYRNAIPNTIPGPLKQIHAVYCDIRDETGSLAAVASLLAKKDLNIKNIGITHTREFQEEALRIDFYDKQTAALAKDVLSAFGYRTVLCV